MNSVICDPTPDFGERLKAHTAPVGVVGLGYVGLPLALAYADAGFRVVGVDVDPMKIDEINHGRSYIKDVRSEALANAVERGALSAATDTVALAQADAIFICVPTPCTRNKEPDTDFIRHAAQGLARVLRRGQLIVLRSTSYPGTTEELVRPILEAAGMRIGRDIYLAFAPERVDPGRGDYSLRTTPVLVGGCDPESTRRAMLVLSQIADQVFPVSSPAAAEMAKLLENVFRNVNIALVNQVAILCDRMGLDVWEIVKAAGTKPYGFLSFQPGPGVGGHCIPVDPYYLAWKAREYDFHMDFVELAARVNDDMPYYVATKVLLALNGAAHQPPRILVLGVAFKRDIDDHRDSPVLKVMEQLQRSGAAVEYHDRFIPELALQGKTIRSRRLTASMLQTFDCVVIGTDHRHIDYPWVVEHARLVFDTRNATAGVTQHRHKIVRLGGGGAWYPHQRVREPETIGPSVRRARSSRS